MGQERVFRYEGDVEKIAEFSRIPPPDILSVDLGRIAIGTIETRFRSFDFNLCSPIVIKDPFDKQFGFFHAYPALHLNHVNDKDIESLRQLQDGSACLIQGAMSTDKHTILHELFSVFGIIHTDTIIIDTGLLNNPFVSFDAAYRPAANQVFVKGFFKDVRILFPVFHPDNAKF